MKITTLVFISILFALPAFGARLQEGYVVKDKAALSILGGRSELVIDHVTRNSFEVYGPKGLGDYLSRNKIAHASTHPLASTANNYISPEEVTAELQALAKAHPETAKLFSIGKSVQGRDLWVMKISRNVQVDDNRPEFKYIANMHGDEIVGRELMMRLIRDLLQDDGKDETTTNLLNDVQIYIMPSMNPDGVVARQRWNANGADLNRDFPNFDSGDQNTMEGRQPETQAVMKWQATRKFRLSANFHGGAEVVNYPWDEMPDPHPRDALVKQLSLEYAGLAPYIAASTSFENGITNGYAWYDVDGGMQDWSDYWYQDLQLTIELSDMKWPNYRDVDYFEQQNKKALLQFISRVKDM